MHSLPAETADGLPAVSNFVLYFEASSIPATGFSSYVVTVCDSSDADKAVLSTFKPLYSGKDAQVTTKDGPLTLHFTDFTLTAVSSAISQLVTPIKIDYAYYKGYCGGGTSFLVLYSFDRSV